MSTQIHSMPAAIPPHLILAPQAVENPLPKTAELANGNSLLDLDREMDALLDQMQDELEEEGAISDALKAVFETYLAAVGTKVDRCARFMSQMEVRAKVCRAESERLVARARAMENKRKQTESLLHFYMASREIKKLEGSTYSIRRQRNGQASLLLADELPSLDPRLEVVTITMTGEEFDRLTVRLQEEDASLLRASAGERAPSTQAIRAELLAGRTVEGASLSKGFHLRIA